MGRRFTNVPSGDFFGDFAPNRTDTGSPSGRQSRMAPPVPRLKVSMETRGENRGPRRVNNGAGLQKVSKSPYPRRGLCGDLETFHGCRCASAPGADALNLRIDRTMSHAGQP